MPERQYGGFNYQKKVIEKFSLTSDENYTGHWDAYTSNGIPVSIKHEKNRTDVEMADFFRQMNVQEDFYLICGFWEEDKNNIVDEKILYIPHESWRAYFDKSFETPFRTLLNTISNDKKDDTIWRKKISEFRTEWKKNTKNLIRPRFKRDHKSQKRIQCAINYTDFYNHFIPKYEVKKIA